MATRKPAPKPAPKPTRKPEPRPAPKLAFRSAPKPAPLDLVRNPNFDAAMAQQNYQNSLAGMQSRAQAGQFDARRDEVGGDFRAPVNQGPQVGGGNQDFIDSRDPNKMYTQDMVDYIDPATGERTSRTRGVVPTPGSRFVPANQAGLYNELQRNQNPIGGLGGQQSTNSTAGYMPVDPNREGYMPVDPNTNMPTLMPIPQGQQGAMASQYQNPQGQQQQMQNYQNFLQQGMQNSNTLNQGAMNNFANMQPGMQATQARQMPAMPVAGMGMGIQQPRQTPAPRKFSTVSNSPARFG